MEQLASRDKDISSYTKEALKKLGVKSLDEKTDLIPKGVVFKRIAGDEPIDEKRKYVSMLQADSDNYRADAEFLPSKGEQLLYEYKTTRPLKIASAQEMAKEIVKPYGDMTIGELLSTGKIASDGYGVDLTSKLNKKVLDAIKNSKLDQVFSNVGTYGKASRVWIGKDGTIEDKLVSEYAKVGEGLVQTFISTTMMGDSNAKERVIKAMKDKGYDGMVDAEDHMGGFEYPLIIFDPKSQIELKSKKNLYSS